MGEVRVIEVHEDVFAQNNHAAADVRQMLADNGTFFINVMSAPGSGKKKMNWNDREKVQLMNDILSNRNRQFRRVRTNAAEKKDVKKKEEINILT